MKLNTEIIRQALEGEIPIWCKGRRDLSLHLGRPEYFLPGSRRFFAGHLYVARGEQLPQRPEIERGAALLCVGESMYLPYYLEDCCVLQVEERTDLCRLFNLLTAVYDRYDAWSQSLSHVLATSGSVREMISCSQEIFGNPLFVLNKEFHFLAQSSYSGLPLTAWEKGASRQSGGDALDLPLLSTFLEHAELNTQKHGAMLINILDSSTLCVNLFQSGVYSGCLIVDYRRREHCPADDALAEHLAGQIELALARYTAPSGDERTSLRQTFQSLIEGLPADLEQQWLLECSQAGREYLCVKVRFGSRLAQLPIGYLCRMLEQSFPGSVAFPHDGAMLGALWRPGLWRNRGKILCRSSRSGLRCSTPERISGWVSAIPSGIFTGPSSTTCRPVPPWTTAASLIRESAAVSSRTTPSQSSSSTPWGSFPRRCTTLRACAAWRNMTVPPRSAISRLSGPIWTGICRSPELPPLCTLTAAPCWSGSVGSSGNWARISRTRRSGCAYRSC